MGLTKLLFISTVFIYWTATIACLFTKQWAKASLSFVYGLSNAIAFLWLKG